MPLTKNSLVVATMAVVIATNAAAADPTDAAKGVAPLIGTWKCVSSKYDGAEVNRPEGFTHVKHVTPTHFMWAVYDKDGKVASALGGSVVVKGDRYVETPEYWTGDGLDQLKGKPQEFTWKVDGKKWVHTGKLSSGLAIDEVWERVEKK